MRRLMFGVSLFAVVAAQSAMAQHQCTVPADQTAFEVQALRSELMVLATGCRDDARYNDFVRHYQPALLANDHAVGAYFKRKFGRNGQQEHDRFVTDLANEISRHGTALGGDFCPHDGIMFTEVMALRSPAELADYAAGKDLVPPAIDICQEPAGKAIKVAATTKAPAHAHAKATTAAKK